MLVLTRVISKNMRLCRNSHTEHNKSPDLLYLTYYSYLVEEMADREDRVVTALNFLTGEGIGYHPDDCDQETLAFINDYFSAPKADEESGSSDSEGLAAVLIYFKS